MRLRAGLMAGLALLPLFSCNPITQGNQAAPAPQDTTNPSVYVIDQAASALTVLQISQGELHPQFDADVFAYTDTIPNGFSTLTVKPEGNGAIKVNGAIVATGDVSEPIDLAVGENKIILMVQLGTKPQKTYTLTVYRLQAAGPGIPGAI